MTFFSRISRPFLCQQKKSGMQWIRQNDQYQLINQGETLVSVTIRQHKHAEAIINGVGHDIRLTGFWNPGYTVTNNSGTVLTLTHSFWGSKGKIRFADGSTFSSQYLNHRNLELQLQQDGAMVVSYAVSYAAGRPVMVFQAGIALEDAEKLLILAALGLTMFSAILTETQAGTDTNAFLISSVS
jgi:hypothetical protein